MKHKPATGLVIIAKKTVNPIAKFSWLVKMRLVGLDFPVRRVPESDQHPPIPRCGVKSGCMLLNGVAVL